MTPPNNVPTPNDILFGGREVVVTDRSGAPRTIQIRQIRIREIPAYRRAEQDPVDQVAFVTGLTPEEIDGLSYESFKQILDGAEAVNGPLARDSEEREQAKTKRALDIAREQMPDLYAEASKELVQSMQLMMTHAAHTMTGAGAVSSTPSPTA
jgi:hypothetical protein